MQLRQRAGRIICSPYSAVLHQSLALISNFSEDDLPHFPIAVNKISAIYTLGSMKSTIPWNYLAGREPRFQTINRYVVWYKPSCFASYEIESNPCLFNPFFKYGKKSKQGDKWINIFY